ncbi:hypothetical protein ACFL6S_35355 [Candidatus Poribacteria bacterium]
MQRMLFLDPEAIESMSNIQLVVNQPQDYQIVLHPDRAWESMFIAFYLTVIEDGGRLRMWYTCRDKKGQGGVAYSESIDGVRWEKPDLGIVEYNGSKHNNLVGIPYLEGTVFIDPHAPPEAKYKYLTSVHREGIFLYFSSDGFHWKRRSEPFLPFVADSQNVIFWEPGLNEYVLYLRGWTIHPRRRTVVRMTTPDLTSPAINHSGGNPGYSSSDSTRPHITTEAPVVFACDQDDPEITDVYTMAALPYPVEPGYYLAFPSLYHNFPGPPEGRFHNDGRNEVHCLGSTNGVNWHRYDRKPYLRPGLDGTATCNMVFIGHGMIQRGDQLWQYGTGYRTTHGDIEGRRKNADGVVFRVSQRLDGFVSVDTDYRVGKLTTSPVSCMGNCLILNLDTGALGNARVEILDAEDCPVPGFLASECDPVQVNSTSVQVTWNGKPDLNVLQGKTIKLCFLMQSCKLYSARFAEI